MILVRIKHGDKHDTDVQRHIDITLGNSPENAFKSSSECKKSKTTAQLQYIHQKVNICSNILKALVR